MILGYRIFEEVKFLYVVIVSVSVVMALRGLELFRGTYTVQMLLTLKIQDQFLHGYDHVYS